MTPYIVLPNQSLLDIAIQKLGSALALLDLAIANGISPTAALAPGQELIIPESEYARQDIADYYEGKKKKIALALTDEQASLMQEPGGIGFMQIENNFIVS